MVTGEEALASDGLLVAAGRAPESPDESWVPSAKEYLDGALNVARERAERLVGAGEERERKGDGANS
jgi:hypothetical protein